MSGWIKVEKDLREDPRVLRMARAIDRQFWLFTSDEDPPLDPCNAGPLPAVTLVVGGLAILWMYADSFARDDDTLDIGPDEINQLTGIKNFAQLMPREWLEIVDAQSVKLPGFHTHNGTEAKRKAVTALRVARHRSRNSVRSVTQEGLPDLDRDHTKTETKTTKRGNGGEAHHNPLSYHGSLPTDAWAKWLEHRRAKKWPVDARTLGAQLALLAPLDTETQRAMLAQSIQAGWQGLFPIKNRGTPAKPHTTAMSTAEAEALEAARGR